MSEIIAQSFVITNCGEVPIKTNGVDLDPGCCRGCPMEHIDKIEAPKGAEYFITYNGDKEPDVFDLETGEVTKVGKDLWTPDVLIGNQRLKAGERTEVITADKPLDMSVDAVGSK